MILTGNYLFTIEKVRKTYNLIVFQGKNKKKFNELSPVSPWGSFSIYFCVLQYLYTIETDTV